MKGDFTRLTFRPSRHYSSVRLQQGRVQLDADWNEQVDIQSHRDRTTTLDLVGPCGAPWKGGGFRIGRAPHLRGLSFVGTTHGWAVGLHAAILVTTNGGTAWTKQAAPAGVTAHLHGVHVVSVTHGWAVGDGGTILATTNGGTAWTKQAVPAGLVAHLRAVHVTSATQGCVVGDHATILTTTDGGAAWTARAAPAGVTAHLRAVHFASAAQGCVVGDHATILTTTNGGTTWTARAAPAGVTAHLRGVHFASATHGWAVGDDGTVLATTNGGTTWAKQAAPAGVTAHLRGVYFASATQGWAVGDDATILVTVNGGTLWTKQAAPAGVTAHLRAIRFAGTAPGLAVGDDATILANATGTSWTAPTSPTIDFTVSPGRMYAGGILCENDDHAALTAQPDLHNFSLPGAGTYLAYLDVWERHLTATDRPELREIALGGPDTATRTQTVWQVKLLPVDPSVNCVTVLQSAQWKGLIAGSSGRLSARARPEATGTTVCEVPPGAGFRRLENQLYRVEVHNPGALGTASFKWSRDNGSIVTQWLKQTQNDLTVSSIGRDSVLGFVGGQHVELTDDTRELQPTPQPGTLVKLVNAQGDVLIINPTTAAPSGPIQKSNFPRNPRIRRWDSAGALKVEVPPTNDGWIPLEEGVEVRFEPGSYKTGDYWLIPARTAANGTAAGGIEWPQDDTKNPLPLLPHGIPRHYCLLALVRIDANNVLTVLSDCRDLFPAVTELTSFFYRSGDGQEAMPDPAQPAARARLQWPLVVGVANGEWPVAGAAVRFTLVTPATGGQLQAIGQTVGPATGTSVVVVTGSNGLAACDWEMEPTTRKQMVEAVLQDPAGITFHLPIRFTANLSVADQVAYDPKTCTSLGGATTVQTAIERLSQLCSLLYVSGDGQHALPDLTKLQDRVALGAPLEVRVANECGPISGASVRFELPAGTGGGLLTGTSGTGTSVTSSSTSDGMASCTWQVDSVTPVQQVKATLVSAAGNPVHAPTSTLSFTARLSKADGVAYNPEKCPPLKDVRNVQDAIDALCRHAGGGCAVTVGKGGQFQRLDQAVKALLDAQPPQFDMCLCLLPGVHDLPQALSIDKKPRLNLKIAGCGPGTRLFLKGPLRLQQVGSFTLADLELKAASMPNPLGFVQCEEVALLSCHISGLVPGGTLVMVREAGRITVADSTLEAYVPGSLNLPSTVFGPASPELGTLFTTFDRREFLRNAAEVTDRIARAPLADRRNLAGRVDANVGPISNRLTPEESQSYTALLRVLVADPVDAKVLARRLEDVHRAAAKPVSGTAVVILDAEADTAFERSQILGDVVLYGASADTPLSEEDLRRLGPLLKSPAVTPPATPAPPRVMISAGRGSLHISRTTMTRIAVAREIVDRVRGILNVGRGEIPGVYKAGFLTDCVIEGGGSQVLAHHVAVTSDAFEPPRGDDAGAVIADAATFVGNHALRPGVVLSNVSRVNQKAANLIAIRDL
ncbi:MAG: hypothetical protein HY660_00570 [Armatimonadetes bacterium]|nr:hypothetical protein [Armatimonadota bacterium]